MVGSLLDESQQKVGFIHNIKSSSRLACQVIVTRDLAGTTVFVSFFNGFHFIGS